MICATGNLLRCVGRKQTLFVNHELFHVGRELCRRAEPVEQVVRRLVQPNIDRLVQLGVGRMIQKEVSW